MIVSYREASRHIICFKIHLAYILFEIFISIFFIRELTKYCGSHQNVAQRHEMSKCCWKMAPADLFNALWPQTFHLEKMQHLQSAIKQGLIVQMSLD